MATRYRLREGVEVEVRGEWTYLTCPTIKTPASIRNDRFDALFEPIPDADPAPDDALTLEQVESVVNGSVANLRERVKALEERVDAPPARERGGRVVITLTREELEAVLGLRGNCRFVESRHKLTYDEGPVCASCVNKTICKKVTLFLGHTASEEGEAS